MSGSYETLEVPRELLATLTLSWQMGLEFHEEMNQLRALLAAPVVEHQEPVAIVIATGGPHDKEDRVLCELQAELPPIGTKLYGSLPAPVDSALPDLAELQATIAQQKDDQDSLQEVIDLTAKAVGDDTGLMWMKIQTAFLRDMPEMRKQIAELTAERDIWRKGSEENLMRFNSLQREMERRKEKLNQAKHDSAHAETEEQRVDALAYWLDQQSFESGMLSCAAATLRSYIDRNKELPCPVPVVKQTTWADVEPWWNANEQMLRDVSRFEGLKGAALEVWRAAVQQPALLSKSTKSGAGDEQ